MGLKMIIIVFLNSAAITVYVVVIQKVQIYVIIEFYSKYRINILFLIS